MNIGIIGSGEVARTVGSGFLTHGHAVCSAGVTRERWPNGVCQQGSLAARGEQVMDREAYLADRECTVPFHASRTTLIANLLVALDVQWMFRECRR